MCSEIATSLAKTGQSIVQAERCSRQGGRAGDPRRWRGTAACRAAAAAGGSSCSSRSSARTRRAAPARRRRRAHAPVVAVHSYLWTPRAEAMAMRPLVRWSTGKRGRRRQIIPPRIRYEPSHNTKSQRVGPSLDLPPLTAEQNSTEGQHTEHLAQRDVRHSAGHIRHFSRGRSRSSRRNHPLWARRDHEGKQVACARYGLRRVCASFLVHRAFSHCPRIPPFSPLSSPSRAPLPSPLPCLPLPSRVSPREPFDLQTTRW